MLTHQIIKPGKPRLLSVRGTRGSRSKPPASQTEAEKSTIELRQKIHMHHFVQFRGEVGDTVYFERGQYRGKKRDKTPWIVRHVEADPEKCHWTNGGKTPLYIELQGVHNEQKITVHTCEKFLINNGGRE